MTQIVNSLQVNDFISGNGTSVRASCKVATTAAGTLASSFASGSTVDGIVLATNDRILIKDQALIAENGIYVVQAGAPFRAPDMETGTSASGVNVRIKAGSVNAGRWYYCSALAGSDIVGTNSLTFVQGGDVTITGAQTLTNKTLTAPILNAVPTLTLDDTNSAFNLALASTSGIATADKTLTFNVNNANRTIGLGGDISTANALTTAGNFALTLTQTGTTNVTLPTTGTLSTLAGAETLTNKTLSTGSTWSGNTITVPNGGTGAVTLTGVVIGNGVSAFTTKTNPTGAFVGTTDVQTLTSKTLTAPILNAVPTLTLDDTNSTFNLALISTSGITVADKTLTLNVNNANRIISLGGDITTANALTTAGNFALTLTQTGATNVTLPTTGTLATLAGAETLTNKTLSTGSTWSGNTITVANGGTGATTLTGVIIGNGTSAFTTKTNPTGAFVGTTDTQTLTNKSLDTTTTAFTDTTTPTKKLAVNTAGSTASTTLTLATAQSTSQTLNIPDIAGTDTLAVLGTAQTFTAVKTFSVAPNMSSLTASQAVVTDASKNLASLPYTNSATASSIMSRDANANTALNNLLEGYSTTITAAGTTTLTVASTRLQFFTGTTTQTVVMPVASTLVVGQTWVINNNSTGNVTVNSSGGNLIVVVLPDDDSVLTCILASGTTAASWDYRLNGDSSQLKTTGASVVVSSAAPPTTGQVLTATSATTATWQNAAVTGITTLNTLTAAVQTFAVGTTGADFNISSATSTHTFNLPDAGAAARGLVTTGAQTFAGAKTFNTQVSVTPITNQFLIGTTNLTTLNFQAPSGAATLTFPNTTDTIVGRATTDTLTNKTLTAPILNAVPTLTLDDTNSAFNLALVSTSGITVADKTLTFNVNNANRTISLGGNITTANALTTAGNFALTLTQTGITNVTLPTTGTLATLAGAETLTNKTLSTGSTWSGNTITVANGGTGATTLTGVVIGNGTSAFTTKTNPTGAFVGTTDVQTLTNKSLDTTTTAFADTTTPTKKLVISTAGSTAATTLTLATAQSTSQTLNVPDIAGTDTIAVLGTAQTFTAVKTFSVAPNMSSLNASQAVVTDGSKNLASLAYTSSATASSIVSRDANANTALNNLLEGYTTTATAAGTTTLTVASTRLQFFTGATTQTIVMPVTTTLVVGQSWIIKNKSSGSLTINASDATNILTLLANDDVTLTCIDNVASTNTSWDARIDGNAIQLRTTGASVVVSTAAPPTTGQVLTATSATAATWQNTAVTGITTLNALTAAVQTFAVGTTGTDFNIDSTTATHTFNIPDASATNRGLVTTGTQTFAGSKTFSSAPTFSSIINGAATLTLPTTTDTIVGRATTDTLTNKTLTAPVLNAVATLTLDDTNSTFNLALVSTSGITVANKTLTFNVNNVNRTISLGGNITTANAFTTAGNFALTLTQTGTTTVTLPTTGTLATLAGAETLTNKTLTLPIISSISNGGTVTIPSGTDTLAVLGAAQTFTAAKTFSVAPIMSSLTASQAVVTDASKNLASLPYTAAATASAIAIRDVNANTALNNLLEGYSTIITAAGTTTLTVASTRLQFFTGATTQTIVMPVTTTLVAGQSWVIKNKSSGSLTINASDASNILTLLANDDVTLTCIDTGISVAASWDARIDGNAIQLRTTGASVVVSTAAPPSIGQVLTATSATAATWQNTAVTGITTLNTLTATSQTFAVSNLAALIAFTSSVSTHTLNIPDADASFRGVVSTGTQTFAGAKTFSSAVAVTPTSNQFVTGTTPNLTTLNFPAPSGAVTLAFPNITDTVVARTTTDTLTNKSLSNSTTDFVDNVDPTKRIVFQTSAASTGCTLTLASSVLTNRTITFPNITGTVTTNNVIQTLTNKTFQDSLTWFSDDGTPSKMFQFQCSGITAATTRTYTAPDADGTLVIGVAGTANQITASTTNGTATLSIPSTFIAPGSVEVTSQLTVGTLYKEVPASIAAAGNTQGTATTITNAYSIVISSTPGSADGVKLPLTLGGHRITISNKSGNNINVYPQGAVAIDGVAANSPVVLPLGMSAVYESSSASQWYTIVNPIYGTANQISTLTSAGATVLSLPSTMITPGSLLTTTGLAAGSYVRATTYFRDTPSTISAAGTTQGTATAIGKGFVIVNVVSTGSAEGVILPVGAAGQIITITNKSGNNTTPLKVYPNGTDTIDGLAASLPVLLPNGATATYEGSSVATQWYTIHPYISAGAGTTVAYLDGTISITNAGATSITGTANQITASASTGAITLSTPSTFIAPGTVTATTSLTVPAPSNQIILGTGTPLTISSAQTTTQTLTIPNITGADAFTTNNFAATLFGKSLVDSQTWFVDNTDATKKLQFELSGITTATTRTLTVPNTSDTIAVLALAQTFTNKTLTSPTINTATISGGTINNATIGATTATTGRFTTVTATSLTNQFAVGTPVNVTTLNFPAPSGAVTLAFPNITDTVVARTTADTLTNKTITGTTNTVSAKSLLSATTTIDVFASAAPTNGQVLTATSSTTATWQTPSGGGTTVQRISVVAPAASSPVTTNDVIFITTTGTGAATGTLGSATDGKTIRLVYVSQGVGTTYVLTVTNGFDANGGAMSTLTFSKRGHSAQLTWDNTVVGWFITGGAGVGIA